MKNIYKKIFVSSLIMAVSFASLLCCCFTEDAQAAAATHVSKSSASENSPCCDHQTQKNTSSPEKKECQCEKILGAETFKGPGFVADNSILLKLKQISMSFIFTVLQPDRDGLLKQTLCRHDQSARRSIPVYLQDSVLRI